jgi:hypothetical protein
MVYIFFTATLIGARQTKLRLGIILNISTFTHLSFFYVVCVEGQDKPNVFLILHPVFMKQNGC